MAIAYRTSKALAVTAAGTDVSDTLPAGILGGDLILLTIGWNNGNTGVTVSAPSVPSGTFSAPIDEGVTVTASQSTYWKVAAGTIGAPSPDAGATVSATLSTGKAWTLSAAVYSGVDTTTPIHAHAAAGQGTSTTHTSPTVAVTLTGCWLVEVATVRDNAATWTEPASLTERTNVGPSAAGSPLCTLVADSNATISTGTRGGETWTTSAVTSIVILQTIALAPQAVLAGPRPPDSVVNRAALTSAACW